MILADSSRQPMQTVQVGARGQTVQRQKQTTIAAHLKPVQNNHTYQLAAFFIHSKLSLKNPSPVVPKFK